MKQNIKYFIVVLIFLCSCAKEGKNIYIEGQVVNPITGEGIEGVRLVLHKEVVDFGSGSSSKIKETAYSDANGNFIIKHNGSLVNKYIVLIEYPDGTEGYHLVGWKDKAGNIVGGYQLPVEKCNLMEVKLELLPYGNFKVKFNNINCNDSTDTLLVFIESNYTNITTQPFFQYGCGAIEGGYIKTHMGLYFINWSVKRNGSIQYFNDTMHLNKNDYRVFEINY